MQFIISSTILLLAIIFFQIAAQEVAENRINGATTETLRNDLAIANFVVPGLKFNTSYRPASTSDDTFIWKNFDYYCDMQSHDCGIKNGPNMYARYEYAKKFLGNQATPAYMLYLDTYTATTNGARLITPYFHSVKPGRRSGEVIDGSGCLSLLMYLSGEGVRTLLVTQQERIDSDLFSWSSLHPNKNPIPIGRWKRFNLGVDLSRGNPRFFITSEITPNQRGEIALGAVGFKYGIC